MKVAAILIDTCRELIYRKTLIVYVGLVTLTHLLFVLALQTDVADGVIAGLSVFGLEGQGSGNDFSLGSSGPGSALDISAADFVRYVQLVVAFMFYSLGILLSVFATASLVPHMLQKGAIDLLLSKPMSRTGLFLSKYLGALVVASANLLYLVGGLAVILAWKTGVWNGGLVMSGLVMCLYFASLLGFLVLIGTVTRSTTVSIMLAALLFFVGLIIRFPHQNTDWPVLITGRVWRALTVGLVEGLYHVLPRTFDMGHVASVLILQEGAVAWGPILNTALVGAGALALATIYFRRTDF